MADELGDHQRALKSDRFVGLGRVARELGLGLRTVQRAADAGVLPTYRLGVRRKVRVADVRRWIETCRVPRR
jgi:excisionase family DNA binding protein